MEIERKWLVKGWPEEDLPLKFEYEHYMRQGYLTVVPTVRIREEALTDGATAYVLCLKSPGGLARKEIELEISKEKFEEIEDLIGLPLIPKVRRSYRLPDGLLLEVNHVDEGAPTEFWYAEIEFPTVERAKAWKSGEAGLQDFLSNEVTEQPLQTMGAYWEKTRRARH